MIETVSLVSRRLPLPELTVIQYIYCTSKSQTNRAPIHQAPLNLSYGSLKRTVNPGTAIDEPIMEAVSSVSQSSGNKVIEQADQLALAGKSIQVVVRAGGIGEAEYYFHFVDKPSAETPTSLKAEEGRSSRERA